LCPTHPGDFENDTMTDGLVQCSACGRKYPVAGGVLRLLDSGSASDEVLAHEQKLWDSGAAEYDTHVTYGRHTLNAMELPATLRALGNIKDRVVLELGCGTGRISLSVATLCRELVAVDFSLNELAILAGKLQPHAPVSLVQADVTQPLAMSRSFDLAFSSQVVQALPTREHRMSMFRWAAEALSDDGRFVFTTYHHGLRNRVFGIARSARYTTGGIYRYYSTISEIKREVAPYFDMVRVRPIQVVVPGIRRLGLPPVFVSRVAERIPGLKNLGILLLVEASQPVRPPQEGDPSMAVESGLALLRRRFGAARGDGEVAKQR
jgi:predicted TPR repeat methyltransferase